MKTAEKNQETDDISNNDRIDKKDLQNMKDKKGSSPAIEPSLPSHIHRLGRSDTFQCDDCEHIDDVYVSPSDTIEDALDYLINDLPNEFRNEIPRWYKQPNFVSWHIKI